MIFFHSFLWMCVCSPENSSKSQGFFASAVDNPVNNVNNHFAQYNMCL